MASSQIASKRELSHAVKLFGMKISLSVTAGDEDRAGSRAELTKSEASNIGEDIGSLSASTSGSIGDKAVKTEDHDRDRGAVADVPRRAEEQQDKRSGRSLKKPEKPVSCPRCNSLDTKFCYFNNYNVNQPRHFCKNCQRYWTAGGTLRNVPVGAGRRKNKNGSSSATAAAAAGAGATAAAAAPKDLHENSERKPSKAPQHSNCKVSRAASEVGSDGMVQARTSEEGLGQPTQNSFSGTSEGSNDSRDDSTCGSSVSNPVQECRDRTSYAGATGSTTTSWPYPFFGTGPWNVAGWSGWNTPWGNMAATAASAAARAVSQNVHTALGKHLREETGMGPEHGSSLWAPKTLRIDAQIDAGRSSSFLADIGSRCTKVDSISTGGMFKAFQQETSGSATNKDEVDKTGNNSNSQDRSG